MSGRTIALMVLLLLVGGAAVGMRVMANRSAEPAPSQSEAAASAGAKETPAPANPEKPVHPRITDDANILEPFGPRLGRMADAFHDDLGIDLYVVTSTEGKGTTAIELQADEIFQQRRIGAGAATGGLLVILNPALGKARIEVGYTLEGGLTDAHMSRMARDQLAPYASYGIAGMAVMDVLHQLRDLVFLSAALGNIELGENFRRNRELAEYQKYTSGGAGAQTALAAQPIDADLKRILSPEQRAKYAPSAKVEESVAAFLRATGDFAGDPTLELFTEGSRLMRRHYPLARLEELQRLERIRASMPLQYQRNGDYVVATSDKPAKGFVPILLHLEQGLWRVDSVETWKNLFFNGEGNYYLRNSNTPYAFGLKKFGKGRWYGMSQRPLAGSIEKTLGALEGRQDAVASLTRAEIWLRNAFVFPQAFLAYEEARRAAPRDPLVLQTLGERAMYLYFPELAIPALEKVGAGVELSLVEAYNEMGDTAGAAKWAERALKENPYDWYALNWQKHLAEKNEDPAALLQALKLIDEINKDPGHWDPVVLSFDPETPEYEPHTTIDVGGTKVFDHSYFGVRMRNTSHRPVVIESVTLKSAGTAAASGLGDIRKYWSYPSGTNRLEADESVYFQKQWGFTVDTGHEHVRYIFRTCWHGEDTTVRQCRTQSLDVLP